ALDLLLDLLPLRQTYVNLGHDVPVKLIPSIDRMFPALRFFRHPAPHWRHAEGSAHAPRGSSETDDRTHDPPASGSPGNGRARRSSAVPRHPAPRRCP
ncbi:MAG: hypothetical protein EOP94_03645, partial [Zymomonas sp.]